MIAIAIASAAILAYIYGGYYLLLCLIAGRLKSVAVHRHPQLPTITVLITARNEQAEILARVRNVLDCEYDPARLQVLVASDGSTDATESIVKGISDPRVNLFSPPGRGGKSATQNSALAAATGEIIVFTDAGTRFAEGFLRAIAEPFASPSVGGVDGHLLFVQADSNLTLRQAQGYYWRQELRLRELESALGTLAVASGACLAVRSDVIRPLPATVGEDCVVPLDVVRAGLRMVHASTAIAYDHMESNPRTEFRARVRMTVRNWQGTWLYPELLNPFLNPKLAWTLWSHKLLRWLSPLFVLTWLASSAALSAGGSAAWVVTLPAAAFVTIAVVVLAVPRMRGARGWRIVWSFLVANAAFAFGMAQVLTGKRILTYRN
jgi:cellulose synthase/poly-beta-1,6-N-acetylglucosamine synthase-like glycosyltransferase